MNPYPHLGREAILRSCADYLLHIQSPEGFFIPQDSNHQEIAIYQIESTWTLLQAYEALGNPDIQSPTSSKQDPQHLPA